MEMRQNMVQHILKNRNYLKVFYFTQRILMSLELFTYY